MSTDSPSRSATDWDQHESPWASGLSVFAGSMMIIVGVWEALTGFAAIVHDDLYVAAPNYIYSFDLTAWGWLHLLLGVLVAGAGFGVLRGQLWGRIIGIAGASLSMMANFLFIPYYPIWSLLIIALDVAVIWALVTHSRDVA
jgi:hypothetical protein